MPASKDTSSVVITRNAEIIDTDKLQEIYFAFLSRYDTKTANMYLTQLKVFLQHNHNNERFGDFDKKKILKFIDDLSECINLISK